MKYFVLLAGYGETRTWSEMSEAEQGAEMAKHGDFAEACEAAGGVELLGGEALAEGNEATTLRTRSGKMSVTDGPFAETTEHIGGYYLVEAPDRETVIDLCRKLPAYDMEIRPVMAIPE